MLVPPSMRASQGEKLPRFPSTTKQMTRETGAPNPMFVRVLTFALCLAVSGLALDPAFAAKEMRRDLSKTFDELTPSEKIAIRAGAKAAYKAKKLQSLKICADPGNMPFSNDKLEGFE